MLELKKEKNTALVVIPARAGSKRIPQKNIKLLMGKPMIAHTIEAAIESSIFDRVVISTDSDEIASIGTSYGAEIPFIRSTNLSGDFTPVSLVTLDALVRLDPDGVKYKYVAQLMANCPLRNAKDIRNSYEQMIVSNGESQISVTRFGGLNPWWAMKMDDQNRLTPIFQEQMTKRSQDLPEIFCPTGAIWWAKADVLRREKTFHTSNRTGWEMPWYRAVDIDTEDDWQLAELLMQR